VVPFGAALPLALSFFHDSLDATERHRAKQRLAVRSEALPGSDVTLCYPWW
jgi:hypothetical protein